MASKRRQTFIWLHQEKSNVVLPQNSHQKQIFSLAIAQYTAEESVMILFKTPYRDFIVTLLVEIYF